MDYAKESLRLHEEWKGKIRVDSAVPVKTMQEFFPRLYPRRGAALS